MPTENPRVNVTLSPSLYSLVGRLAVHQRISKSMVLRELLEAAEPALVQALALMEAAKGASVQARKTLADDMDKRIKGAEAISEMMLHDLATQHRDLVSEAETIRGRRPPRANAKHAGGGTGAGKRPPSSNRGVKS